MVRINRKAVTAFELMILYLNLTNAYFINDDLRDGTFLIRLYWSLAILRIRKFKYIINIYTEF